MNVTAQNHDEVSALLTVTLNKADYKDQVEKQLHNFAKNARIPGFRKGKVPMSLVKKQYEAGIAYEEINKQISDALNKYVDDHKLRLVGQPIPQTVEDLDYQKEQLSVNFEIGYEPNFKIDLSKYEAPHYKIDASDKEINQSIENMQKKFGEREEVEKADKDSYLTLEVSQIVEENAEGEHHHHPKKANVSKEQKAAFGLVKKLASGETVKITKEELQKNEELAKELGFSKEEVEHLHHQELEIKVTDIYNLKLHDINQELFDKVYGEGNIKSEEELRSRVKTELDEYFQQNADIHFVNKIIEQVKTKEEVKLPEEFLIKWLMYSNKDIKDEERAKEILEAEKDQIKEQVLDGKLLNDHDIKLEYNEVLEQAELLVKNQFAMYGIHNLSEEEIRKFAVDTLKNEEQVRHISNEVTMSKLKDIVLEKSTKKETKVSHDEFLELLQK